METPIDPTSLNHRILEGFARIAVSIRGDDWDRTKHTGLNPTQLAILELLDGRILGMGVRDIATHFGVSQPTATDSINALERKGLVTKRSALNDKRAVNIVLAEKGISLLRDLNQTQGLTPLALDRMTGHDQADLLLLLVKVIRHLQVIGAIPVQRMCVNCRHFAPFAHAGSPEPHHCGYIDAAFGRAAVRVDCRDFYPANPDLQERHWETFDQRSGAA